MSDSEFIEAAPDHTGYESDDAEGYEQEAKHKGLIDKISTLNLPEQVRRRKIRSEPRDQGEFNLLQSNATKVNLSQLTQAIKGAGTNDSVGKIKKVAKKLTTKKVLNKPLEKVHKDRIERSVHYEGTAKEVTRWEPVVLQNRVADELHFPLQQPDNRIDNALESAKKFKAKSSLEKEIQNIFDSSENYLDEDVGLTEAEEKALQAMSIEEARARHQELRKTRALLSYREAKLSRQNKIKSKSYRKMLKREKLRKSMKEFETLKEKDPVKALEKLQELEKLRIQERASLKHLKTGKWSKINKIRAKYDQDARDKLAEQVNLNKDLMKRLYESEESEHSEDDAMDQQIVTEKNALMQTISDTAIINENGVETNENVDNEMFERNYNNLVDKIVVEDLERQKSGSQKQKRKRNRKLNKKSLIGEQQGQVEEGSASEDEHEGAGSDADDGDKEEEEYKRLVSEALAEDDVIADFQKDKQELMESEQAKGKDNFLPGWGRWAGSGIQVKDRVRKRYEEKVPQVKRKDREMKNVVISEKKDQVIAKYLPKSLPAGTTDRKSYEKKVIRPIGSTWNPETIFKTVVKPSVTTKLGTKINPMSEKVLAKAKRLHKRKDFSKKVNNIIKLH